MKNKEPIKEGFDWGKATKPLKDIGNNIAKGLKDTGGAIKKGYEETNKGVNEQKIQTKTNENGRTICY